jgi:hypothetical protein
MNSKHLWFKCSIGVGLLLSVLLLVETLVTYCYVERDLVREEAQREASRRIRSIQQRVTSGFFDGIHTRTVRRARTGNSSDVGRYFMKWLMRARIRLRGFEFSGETGTPLLQPAA